MAEFLSWYSRRNELAVPSGQLSHGAIVAREYGLPAVVNVPGATQRIDDGQHPIVDGSTGRVTIL